MDKRGKRFSILFSFQLSFILCTKRPPAALVNGSQLDEKELFLLISEGDEMAFRQVFSIYMPFLFPMIVRVVKNQEAARDIIQETFLRVWLNRDKLPEIEKNRSWVLQIAYHLAFTHLRNQAIHQKALNKISGKQTQSALRSDTEEAVSFKIIADLVKKAVHKLPPQQKKVYELNRVNGLKIAEIARQLSLSEQSVKNTLGRALKFLREHLAKEGYRFLSVLLLFFSNRY